MKRRHVTLPVYCRSSRDDFWAFAFVKQQKRSRSAQVGPLKRLLNAAGDNVRPSVMT